jgi:hypothetical protein
MTSGAVVSLPQAANQTARTYGWRSGGVSI